MTTVAAGGASGAGLGAGLVRTGNDETSCTTCLDCRLTFSRTPDFSISSSSIDSREVKRSISSFSSLSVINSKTWSIAKSASVRIADAPNAHRESTQTPQRDFVEGVGQGPWKRWRSGFAVGHRPCPCLWTYVRRCAAAWHIPTRGKQRQGPGLLLQNPIAGHLARAQE